jgi:DNA-directed RNA polymerase specialized sigma24 family protein
MFNAREVADLPLALCIFAAGTKEKASRMTLADRVNTLFQELRVPVFRFLLRKTHDAGYAEDLTQETFLRLCKHLQQIVHSTIPKRGCSP